MSISKAFSDLPDEILVSIISLLDPEEIVLVQRVSRRLHGLACDGNLWKEICFDHSRFESGRRRQEWLASQDGHLAQLRRALEGVASDDQALSGGNGRLSAASQHAENESQRRVRALANWDPTYPLEQIDFHQEYRQRHGPIAVQWLQESKMRRYAEPLEAMGLASVIDDQGEVCQVAAPMDNGSLCIWELSSASATAQQGRIIAQSPPGLLSVQPNADGITESITNETGAIENVSIDSKLQRGYFAVHDTVSEVDLNTLTVINRKNLPFPVSCISAAEPFVPLTVGTTHTMHLFDPRIASERSTSQTEQIGGTDTSLHSSLSEPGPLSILHHPLPAASNEIWVAGRFKSLLCYDRRFWPRVKGNLFTNSRLSSLSVLPHPFLSRNFDLMQNPQLSLGDRAAAKSTRSVTLMAAGEYRGKGSLELYNLSPDPSNPTKSAATDSRFQNRQTASRTRLLSVAPHGTRIVYVDGDGNMKWTERDGSTLVREFNINDHIPKQRGIAATNRGAEIRTVYHERDSGIGTPSSVSSMGSDEGEAEGLFAEGENGDIMQRVVPTGSKHNDLLIWTADGRLGLVGFGNGRDDEFGRGVEKGKGRLGVDGKGEDEDEERREREEQLFGMRMRRALERQANEARFVKNLGMGGRWK